MDYFDSIGECVKKVIAAVEREGEACVLPEHLQGKDRHSEAAQQFEQEFAKKSEEIDKQAREALGTLITGLLTDVHVIATSIKTLAKEDVRLLDTPQPK